jgi:hypothetical protein
MDDTNSEEYNNNRLNLIDNLIKKYDTRTHTSLKSSKYYSWYNDTLTLGTFSSMTAAVLLTLSSIGTHDNLSILPWFFGLTGIVLQIINNNMKYKTKAILFNKANNNYNSLLMILKFEKEHPKSTMVDLYERMKNEEIAINSDCKYYPPLHIYNPDRKKNS